MRPLIRISIDDADGHWRKSVWVLGIHVYHRHDFTKESQPRTCGFNVMPYAPMDVGEEDNFED